MKSKADRHEIEIREALRASLQIRDNRIEDILFHGLYDALGYHEQVGGMYCNEQGIKQFSEELKATQNALRKLNKHLRDIAPAHRKTLDSFYYAANNCDRALMDMPLPVDTPAQTAASAFELVAQRMENTIAYMQSDIQKPGKGNFRQQGKKYIAGIEMLARFFSEALPNQKLSAQSNSIFYRYVSIWFEYILANVGVDDFKDLRRHISNTLKHPNVRLRHH